ncbi:MAG: acyl-CoA/acyl-ACP dehydrogenase, partial [Frankiales bacterium]|nr:acyl-CoA/acyl-ACP dehydrogenase [Frankiales bacterium]
MDMDFTPEQELLRETVRRTCERHCNTDEVRRLENNPVGYAPALWSALGELGLLGLTIPEDLGGSGMTLLDGALAYEELGRAIVPSPHFVSCVLAAGLIQRAGGAVRDEWLPRIASGEAIVTAAWLEPDGGFGPRGITTTAEPTGDGFALTGTKRHVPFASAATAMLVPARTDEGVGFFLVDSGASGLSLEQQLTVAGDTQYRVSLDRAPGTLVTA